MQTIRRYSNRKFYHLEGHRYVNLADIAALVRGGDEVRIFSHPSGEEITTEVLAQIIAQERPAWLASWLAALIRWGRTPIVDAGRAIRERLGLPTFGQWQRLEEQVARLEALVQRLLDAQQ